MADRTVAVRLRARVDAYQADLRKAAAETNAFAAKAGTGFKSVTKSAANMGDGVRIGAGIALAAMGAFAVKSIKAASDLNETVSKTGVLFGKSAGQIESWASTASTSMGQSKKQAMDAAASFAVFGKSAGLSGDALVEFSKQNVQLASDMASFFNTSPEDAIQAIGSAFRGEAEPIRAYGILLDDATLRQSALEMGLISTTKNALTPQQKVLAAQAVIMKQTTDAQGDFARTSDGLANSQRILAAQFEDTQAQLGQALLPVALKATTALGAMLRVVNGLPSPLKMTAVAAVAAGAGFILLAPRIVATVEAYKALTAAGTAAGTALGRVGKITAAASPYLAVAAAIAVIASGTADATAELDKMLARGEELDRIFAATNKPSRMQELADEAAALRDQINQTVTDGGFFTSVALGWEAIREAGLNGDVEGAIDRVAARYAEAAREADASARNFGDAAYAVGLIVSPASLAAKAIAGVTAATKEWKGIASRGEAEDKLAEGFDNLAKSVKENKGTLSGTTDAARDARTAFRSSMGDIAAYAETFKDPTRKADALRTNLDKMRDKLAGMGLSNPEILRLIKPYEEIADKARAAAEQQARIQRNIDITVTYTNRGKVPNADGKPLPINATGGLIRGPGSGTSDSIISRVSNGEYVVRASAVDKYGVDFLDAVNQGALPGYAKGGKVKPTTRRVSGGTTARRNARTAAIERVGSLRSDRASAIESTASSMASAFGLMGAFDFGAQARAIDDLASAQERLASASQSVADADGAVFEARRAINMAGSPKERADAEKKLAEALERQTKARAGKDAATGDVAAAKVAVKKAAATPGNVLAAWQGRLRALVNFRKNLDALRKKGFAPNIIAQIAQDPDGAEVAAALVKATPSQIKAFNATDAALAKVSGAVGRIAGGAQYDNSIRAAQQAAMGLGATAKQVGPMVPRFNQPLVLPAHVHIGKRQIAEATADLSRREGGFSWA